jgi:cation diffusion facilitator CzcD-associated flavoprotein CzcO
MPYLELPANWPVSCIIDVSLRLIIAYSWKIFTPKDKLAEWFEAYVQIMELCVWNNTTLTESVWNEQSRSWTVKVKSWSDGKDKFRKCSE